MSRARAANSAAGRASRRPAWQRLGWRLRGLLRAPRATLVYDHRYDQDIPGSPMDALRAEKILRFLKREGLLSLARLVRPRPASMEALLRVHAPEYIEGLQAPEALTRACGVNFHPRGAERFLDLQRLMTGGTLLAAELAVRTRRVAVNLGGGFHHAERARGLGYCIFNDVAVAIAHLRAQGFTGRVLVIDLDVHDGNGTRALFADDPDVHTYSIHADDWGPRQAAAATVLPLGHGVTDERYLQTLHGTLPGLLETFRPALLFYVAGADPAEDDQVGDWSISAAALLARDRLVYELARARPEPLPVVTTLAGGYGGDAWRHPARTLAFLLSGRVLEPPDTDTIVFERLHGIGDALHASDLTLAPGAHERPFELSEEDLIGVDPSLRPETRFLEVYPRYALELLLERFGLLRRLRDKGFPDLRVELPLDAPLGQTLRILAAEQPPLLLVELRVRRSSELIPGNELIVVEWLLLQHPRADFGPRRARLPGQQHPGLGLLREFLAFLAVLGEKQGVQGIAFSPAHYHVAVQSRKQVRFLHPECEARLRACQQALEGLSLADATRLVHAGRLRDTRSGVPFAWRPCPMVLPLAEELRARLNSAAYEAEVQAAGRALSLTITPASS